MSNSSQDKNSINKSIKKELKTFLKKAKATKTYETVNEAVKKIDSALSKGVIKSNKANRLKSKIQKILTRDNDATEKKPIDEVIIEETTYYVSDDNMDKGMVNSNLSGETHGKSNGKSTSTKKTTSRKKTSTSKKTKK